MILQNIGRRVVGSILVNFPVFCLRDFIINVGLALVVLSIVLVIAMCLREAGRPSNGNPPLSDTFSLINPFMLTAAKTGLTILLIFF